MVFSLTSRSAAAVFTEMAIGLTLNAELFWTLLGFIYSTSSCVEGRSDEEPVQFLLADDHMPERTGWFDETALDCTADGSVGDSKKSRGFRELVRDSGFNRCFVRGIHRHPEP